MNKSSFNQLWIQFSLAFAAVVLLAVLSLFAVGWLLRPDPPERPTELTPQEQAVRAEEFRNRGQRFVTQSLFTLATAGGVIVIAAGVWMARRMTAPLDDLTDGAKAIGSGNLSYRVQPKGSSEMVSLAESFNQMAADLEESDTLRQNLLSDVAHELRTPLTVLQGNLRAILDDVYQLDKAEVARLYDQTRHLNRLVNDLREVAQAEAQTLSLNMQRVDIAEQIETVAALFEPMADEMQITLNVAAPDLPIYVQADPSRITQVLHNLLSNALRHTSTGGQVSIFSEQQDGSAKVSVVDSGEGIRPEHLPYIFDRFYRTDSGRDRESGGTGLGLALVRGLIEAHNGTVAVTSAGAGTGSTFTISLPLQS